VKRDVEAFLEKQDSAPAAQPAESTPAQSAPAAPAAKSEPAAPAVAPFTYATGEAQYEDTPISQMRKVIARRLGESKFTAPHFYLTVEINMDKAVSMRQHINEIAPTKISFNDFVLKACAAALRLHPAINSSWLGDKIRQNKDINIGVAVAVPDGLLVPVVRYADMKSLSQINVEVKTLAGKAKDRKLQPDEMSGNTFTISNLGMFGIDEFTAIINPPDSCIMAVGGIIQKPIVKDGNIVVGNMMKVTLSCDHRVVDGATGAQFLNTVKDILENPIRLMV
jgi:pyruvate dehydrogenase E2 component (dihydrolipoamide acetyltransferase)